nr:MAG TPA: hypothetical protein [Caudoviricetes sp.]
MFGYKNAALFCAKNSLFENSRSAERRKIWGEK